MPRPAERSLDGPPLASAWPTRRFDGCGVSSRGTPVRSFGAVIGKALSPLTEGHGVIPILIALQ